MFIISVIFFFFFLQPVKTYTRRGRGKCANPKCSFVYVTRHKPPECPECGQHLGGKWIPVQKLSDTYKVKYIYNSLYSKYCFLCFNLCILLYVGNQVSKCQVKNLVIKKSEPSFKASKSKKKQTLSSGKCATPGGSSNAGKEQSK